MHAICSPCALWHPERTLTSSRSRSAHTCGTRCPKLPCSETTLTAYLPGYSFEGAEAQASRAGHCGPSGDHAASECGTPVPPAAPPVLPSPPPAPEPANVRDVFARYRDLSLADAAGVATATEGVGAADDAPAVEAWTTMVGELLGVALAPAMRGFVQGMLALDRTDQR